MTRDQDLERHLSEWLAGGPVTAPREVVDEAIERTVERPQHHPILVRVAMVLEGLSRPRTRAAPSLPLTAVVVVAVLLIIGSIVVLEPLGRGPGRSPSMDPLSVRTVDGRVAVVSVTDTAGGSERVLRIKTEDPRIRGEARQILATMESPEADLGRSTGLMRVENEWGAWEGIVEGVRYPDGTEIEYGWLTGDRAYAGFTYFHSTRDHPVEAERALEGAIWPGETPPMPDPSLLQADPLG